MDGLIMQEKRAHMDDVVRKLSQHEVRDIFSDLDKSAETHGPLTRQFYLALYRRLHG